MSDTFDLVVVGAGPGGYVAAIRAAQLGLKTAIVERSHLGGICLNWGCIPTKALLRTGEIYESLTHLSEFGIAVENPSFDFSRIIQRSRETANKLSAGVAYLMRKNHIEVVEGTAKLEPRSAAPRVQVILKAGGNRELTAPAVLVATGARPKILPASGMAPDGHRVWTYREAMFPAKRPQSLTVIGSGAIGTEFASFYRALGSDVTVVEAAPNILPIEDGEISQAARKAFEKRGIKFRTGASVTRISNAIDVIEAEIRTEGRTEVLRSEVAIVAIGIDGNVEGLGLEDLGVTIERNHIVTTNDGEAGVPGLYAIGDVAGPPWLAHKASHEGVRCVERIAGVKNGKSESPIPGCTYSQPQIASVGLTEEQARSRGLDVKIGRFAFRNNGKAIALGETEGFVKTIFDARYGELLGAHMIGPEVTEMIQGFALAMTLGTTEAELMAAIFPHPTLSEAMHEAVLGAYGVALHI